MGLLTIMTSAVGFMGILIYIVCWAVMPIDDGFQDLR